ncbi:hypothetical protein [Gordonia oryzae]|nr:hypothetical protein [Gordonia oryzae]
MELLFFVAGFVAGGLVAHLVLRLRITLSKGKLDVAAAPLAKAVLTAYLPGFILCMLAALFVNSVKLNNCLIGLISGVCVVSLPYLLELFSTDR